MFVDLTRSYRKSRHIFDHFFFRSTSWLGVLDYNVEGQFLCSSSERISYTNWGTEQPDNNVSNFNFNLIGRKGTCLAI